MKFDTEVERKRHPQASLIPPYIWWYSFNKEITKSEIILMKSKPQKIRFSSLKWRPYSVCLCILYGHSEITAPEFLALLDKKRTTLKYAMNAAVIAHREDILRLISKQYPKELQSIIESNDFDVIRTAVRLGSFSTIKYVVRLYTGNLCMMLRAGSFEVFLWSSVRSRFKCKLFDYFLSLAPELKEEVISFRNFHFFKKAAKFGNSAVIHRLVLLSPNKIEYMLSSEGYEPFSAAASGGKISMLKLLFSFIPEKMALVIRSRQYHIFNKAAECGRIKVIKYLFNLVPFEIQNMLISKDYWAFYVSMANGHLLTFNYLFKKLTKEQQDDMVHTQFKPAFQQASEFGYDKALLHMRTISPSIIHELIIADNYESFRKAAARGHIKVLFLLVNWAPDKVHEMVSADDFGAFRAAAYAGSLEIINYLFNLFPLASRWMIFAQKYEAFSNAAAQGHLPILKILALKAPDSICYMLGANKCLAVCEAIRNSHFSVVKYLIKIARNRAKGMIVMNDFLACHEIKDVRILKLLISLVPEHKERIISLNDFGIFRDAVVFSKLDVLEYLRKIVPDKMQEMIAAKGFISFARAARINNDLEVLHYLLQWAPDKLDQMVTVESIGSAVPSNTLIFEFIVKLVPGRLEELICANRCKIFREAVQEGNLPIIKFLFQCAPDQINEVMELDKDLIKIPISREHIDVLDFMLSCNPALLFKEIFLYPEKPYFGQYDWKEKAGTSEEETLLHNISKIFFENPSKLSVETQYEFICAFITLGYFSIAKALMIRFWNNTHPYNLALFIEVLIRSNYYPNKITELLDFLVEFLHVKPSEIIRLLNRISSDDLPLKYMGRFDQPRIDFSD